MSVKELDHVLDVARETLRGDIRDHILEYLKANKDPLPFNAMPEASQRDLVERTEKFADKLLEGVVGCVAADGRDSMRFSLKGIQQTTKGNVSIKLETPFDAEYWSTLGAANTVELVVADSRAYRGERKPGWKHVISDQGKMFSDDDAGGEVDEGPVMDQTPAGKAMKAEKPEKAPAKAAADKKPLIDPKTKTPTADGYLAFAAAVNKLCEKDETITVEDAVERSLGAGIWKDLGGNIDMEKLSPYLAFEDAEEAKGSTEKPADDSGGGDDQEDAEPEDPEFG